DLRYIHPWGQWLTWDSTRWKPDDSGEAMRRTKDTVTTAYSETAKTVADLGKELASAADDDAKVTLETRLIAAKKLLTWLRHSEQAARLNAMLALAQSDRPIPIQPDELDSDPMLLNVLNGTINLCNGELQQHQRKDYVTRLAPVKCERD